jgi:hypothetical protein
MIPYRYQEVLQTLSDNPKGLTTAQIMKTCRSKPGSELPDDQSVVSKLVYSMRAGSKYITSSDALGGAVHKITQKGKEALAEALRAESSAPTPEPAKPASFEEQTGEQTDLAAKHDNAIDTANSSDALKLLGQMGFMVLDPDEELDLPFIQIISVLRAAYGKPGPVAIERKEEKISTLSRLGALMSDDIKSVFDDIAQDLDKLEPAS